MFLRSYFPVIFLVVVSKINLTVEAQNAEGPMIEMVEAMQQLMTGDASYFDPAFLDELLQCWENTHPDLKKAEDNAWQGMIDYFQNDGFDEDPWGQSTYNSSWLESNATSQELYGIIIYEPCNYASNIAYYHDATEICKNKGNLHIPRESSVAVIQAFSYLGFGSAFWHGSVTDLGITMDVGFIDILAYVIHQASVENLRILGASPIITDLSFTPRNLSGINMTSSILDMFIHKPVYEWKNHIDDIDKPDRFLIFSGIVSSACSLALNDDIFDSLAPILLELLGVEEQFQDFILNEYIPEFRALTANLQIGPLEKLQLQGNLLSTLVKLVYAFLWDEESILPPFVFDPEANEMGAELIPLVNSFGNRFNDFTYYEQNFQDGYKIYPGDEWCNPLYPHTKWHLQSGIGLLDLFYLMDNVNELTQSLQ